MNNANGGILDVYICSVSDGGVVDYPEERVREIQNITSLVLRRQKSATWTLLKTAAEHSYGYDFTALGFEKLKNGKWVCDKFWFSMSHTSEYAFVAVSDSPCGIDAENRREFAKRWQNSGRLTSFVKKITADGEKHLHGGALELWIKKESAYKFGGEGNFCPGRINTDGMDFVLGEYCGNAVAVCGGALGAVRFFECAGSEITETELKSVCS